MSRLLALLVILTSLGCDVEQPTTSPPRRMSYSLYEASSLSAERAQPTNEYSWSGRESDTVAIQMTAPVTARANVTPSETSDGQLPDEIAVFFDGAGQLGDFGNRLDSTAQFEQRVLPSTYDVLVAPDALLGRHAARLITPVPVIETIPTGEELVWALPEPEIVIGEVVTWNTGVPVPGAIVSVFRATEPRLPLGVTAVTGSDGTFAFEVPEGRYDIVVSGPSDGSVVVAPVRRLDQQLPLFEGLSLRFEVWPVQPIPARGRLVRAGSADPVTGRVRIDGRVADPFNNATGIRTGRYRVELETESDGSWEVELPAGTYTATGIPRYAVGQAPTRGIGNLEFDIPFGATSADGLDVSMPGPVTVRIEAYNPDGAPMIGATLLLRMHSAPRYAWRYVTGASGALEGAFVGQVIEDKYDIELIPPPDEDGKARLARVQVTQQLGPNTLLQLSARRSDRFQGFVFTANEQPAGDIRVMVRDPDSGRLWDSVVTRDDSVFSGVFDAVVPR